jgi:broad specificity phosphatase PhoE
MLISSVIKLFIDMSIVRKSSQLVLTPFFYLVRHGETELNRLQRCVGGGTDVPLNETGVKQAAALQALISTVDIQNVITSPMKRATQTAQLLTTADLVIEEDLREWEIGVFEQAPLQEFLDFTRTHPDEKALPHGESKREFFKRVMNVILRAIETYDSNWLVVAHGGIYWAILDGFNLPYDHLENGTAVKFEYDGDLWRTSRLS